MSPGATAPTDLVCARHPQTPTLLRCGRCGTPICPRCMINTDVGQRCPDCGHGSRLPTFQVSPQTVTRAAAAGLLTATVLAFIWSLVPGFSFWLGLLTGFVTGEAIARATNYKRGPGLMATAALTVFVGFVLGYVMLGRDAGLAVLINPLLLFRFGMFTVISLGLAMVIAAIRQRG